MSNNTTELREAIIAKLGNTEEYLREDVANAIMALVQDEVRKARKEELKDLDTWIQMHGWELHVSHVCPEDNIECAKFAGRTQKMHQLYDYVYDRLATLNQTTGEK